MQSMSYRLILLVLIILSLSLFWLLSGPIVLRPIDLNLIYPVDLLQYWSAAKIFLAGGNPYDFTLLNNLQIAAGRPEHHDLIIMWNPPIILLIILPLALFSFSAAAISFFLAGTVGIATSFLLSRLSLKGQLLNLPKSLQFFSILFLVTFYPAFLSLAYGQISFVLLLSLSLYFFFSSKSSYTDSFAAGICLSLTLIKPHVLYLLYFFILWRSFTSKSWGTIAGLISGASILFLGPLVINSEIFFYYLAAASRPPIFWQTPTLGSWLQGWTGLHEAWVRFMPTIISALVFVLTLLRFPSLISNQALPFLIIPISLFTSPYGWVYDQMLLLPSALWMIGISAALLGPKPLVFIPASILIAANIGMMAAPAEAGQHVHVWYPILFFILALVLLIKQNSITARQ